MPSTAVRSILALALAAMSTSLSAQSNAIADGKRILDLLREGKSEAVAAEFNEKMAAAISKEQLAQVWNGVTQQAGGFQKVVDEQATTPQPGYTAVVLGLQFENTLANFMVVFDSQNKIAGLRINPRPPQQ